MTRLTLQAIWMLGFATIRQSLAIGCNHESSTGLLNSRQDLACALLSCWRYNPITWTRFCSRLLKHAPRAAVELNRRGRMKIVIIFFLKDD